MTQLAFPYTLQAGQPENVNQLNANLDAVKTLVNGGLDATNLSAAAGITAGQLAAAVQAALWAPGDIKATSMNVTAGSEPVGWLFADGRAVSRSTYPALFSAVGVTYGPGDGSTTFNLPDYRGRTLVGLGTHAEVDALTDNDALAVGSRKVKHRHGTDSQGNHSHGGGTGGESAHFHGAGSPFIVAAFGVDLQRFTGGVSFPVNYATFTQGGTNHNHSISTDGAHTHNVGDQAGPLDAAAYQVVNYLVKT